jgi:hypothetical protein
MVPFSLIGLELLASITVWILENASLCDLWYEKGK